MGSLGHPLPWSALRATLLSSGGEGHAKDSTCSQRSLVSNRVGGGGGLRADTCQP